MAKAVRSTAIVSYISCIYYCILLVLECKMKIYLIQNKSNILNKLMIQWIKKTLWVQLRLKFTDE